MRFTVIRGTGLSTTPMAPILSRTRNEFLRNYASKRNYSQITCANGYANANLGHGFQNYESSYTLWENNISEGPVPQIAYGGFSIDTINGNNAYGAQFLGNISLNATGFNQNPHTSTDILSGLNYSNNVVITPTTVGMYVRGTTLNTVDHFSIFSPNGSNCVGPCDGFIQDNDGSGINITPSSTVGTSFIFNNPKSIEGFLVSNGTSSMSDLGSSGAGASAISNNTVSNPFTAAPTNMGSCYLWIPSSSNLSAAASDGTDMGATVLYEYSEGSITATPLWSAASGAFHGGAIVAGINDVAGSSLFDVQSRLNVNQNGCSYPSSYVGW